MLEGTLRRMERHLRRRGLLRTLEDDASSSGEGDGESNLTCLDPASGVARYTERLDAVANVYASPVAADGRIYVVGREGTAVVLSAGPKLEVLATNALDDGFDASPALVDGEMYLRGRKSLYRISA